MRQLLAQGRRLTQLCIKLFSRQAGAVGAELREFAFEIRGSLVQQTVGLLPLALLVTKNIEVIVGLRGVYR